MIDECEREVCRQLKLVADTRDGLSGEILYADSKFKECPVCTTLTDREGCQQIYCTVCKTVWMWDTMKVVTNIDDIHNPVYFDMRKYRVSSNDIVTRCLDMLSTEHIKYSTDVYMLRVMLITRQLSIEEFKNRIRTRYSDHVRYTAMFERLQEVDDVNLCITYLFGE